MFTFIDGVNRSTDDKNHGKKYMYIPPIYDHGHCGSLIHGGFLFRDFPPQCYLFFISISQVLLFSIMIVIFYTVPSNFYFTFVMAIQIVIFWTVPSNLCFTFVLSILIVVFALFQVLWVLPLSCLSRLWFFFPLFSVISI